MILTIIGSIFFLLVYACVIGLINCFTPTQYKGYHEYQHYDERYDRYGNIRWPRKESDE